MCRIAGIVDNNLSSDELEISIQKMTFSMKHGGPDGEGRYINPSFHIGLGHRRLALLDLSEAGAQPMFYEDKRYVISYNGEIYNYPALKSELEELNITFKTQCDTEMILIAFATWGTACFEKFEGMFAISIFDSIEGKLFLARDHSGIKPLYYYFKDKRLYFSSEVRALKLFRDINHIDEDSKILLLAFGHIPEPFTILQDVKMLEKGHYIEYDLQNCSLHSTCFNRFIYTEEIADREKALTFIAQKLNDSVKMHLLSDAPIGLFLSGGIDSSILTLLANQKIEINLNTLSLYFNETEFDEKKFQDIIIQKTNSKNHQFLLTGVDFSKNLENVITDMDMPSTDGINTWFISKYAKLAGLKAVLSGVGADELFGGYPSFRRIWYVKLIKKFPKRFISLLSKLTMLNKIKRLAFLTIDGNIGEYLFLRGLFSPMEISKILNIEHHKVIKTLGKVTFSTKQQHLSTFKQASSLEFDLYMQNQLLRDSDVMSMAHGVEIRVPFLDLRLIQFVFSIRSKLLAAKNPPKKLLIESFSSLLPRAIWKRKKMGFTFPFHSWMNGNSFISQTLSKNMQSNRLLQKFNKGKLPWAYIMALLVLEKKINE